uniref:Lymphocyte cytosolic protein 2 n=1 Tax=Vombatus ursinus TaxID=29139 RepID=A0A4X2JSD5_VOMUR
MALSNVPYRSEVLAWGPDELADYFKKLNYKDCEKVVKKHHISGPRFLNLSENDVQKFPKLRVPILSKLSQEINKNEERRSLFFQEEDDGGWSSFEEDDYESPNEDQDGDYESPSEEVEPAPEDDADYEPPPSNDEDTMQNTILPAKLPTGSMYIDRPPLGKTPQQPPVPPQRPLPAIGGRSNTPPHLPQPSHEEPVRGRNHRAPNFPAPSIDRSKKPPLDRTLPQFERDLGIGETPGDHLPKIQKPPLPPGERHERNFKKPPNSLNNEWYVSYITRTEAEAALRKINKDGTFLVRDSSKKTITNPYVLMVLYKNKVYNIQIRYNEESQVYLLGTGLRGKEDFLSVPDIIDYFRKMPLLLIDGKNRDSRNQCMLIYAAGFP